jgi:tetracycline repressor-like protein
VDLDRVVEVKRISTTAVISLADAIEQAFPPLGRPGALDILLACRLLWRPPLWQIAHPPKGLIDAFAEEPEVPPEWNLDFASALTRLLTATCVGLLSESH